MHLLVGNAAALAVAVIFYVWREYFQAQHRRRLPERVAYMLWVMANRAEKPDEVLAAD